MILSKNNFKSKPVNFSNLIDDISNAVEVAMDAQGINDNSYCKVKGIEMVDSESDEVLCKVTMIDILNAQIWFECSDGVAIIPLDIFR